MLLVTPVVAIHHKLVRSCNQLQAVGVVEVLRDVLAKGEASTSRGDAPTVPVVWVRPKQVAHWAFMRHFYLAVNLLYLIEGIQVWREATVKAEDLVFDDGSQRQ